MPLLDAAPRPAPGPVVRSTRRTGPSDAQYQAAAILGRVMEFFDTVESCSREDGDRARRLIVSEIERRSVFGPQTGDKGTAVLTAALACLPHDSPGQGEARKINVDDGSFGWGARRRARRPSAQAGLLFLRVQQVLEHVAPYPDRGPAPKPRVADALAYMLQGAEPRTWSEDRQGFARCVLDCVASPA
jgi:hypothetical protein